MANTITVKDIVDFFLEAAAKTYASGKEPSKSAELPGAHVYSYERGLFSYRDVYYTHHGMGMGQTTICYGGVAVWTMQYYGGCTDPKSLPFLRKCLLMTYEQGQFICGRGPRKAISPDGSMVYENVPQKEEDVYFHGKETIKDLSGVELFFHRYTGMVLK